LDKRTKRISADIPTPLRDIGERVTFRTVFQNHIFAVEMIHNPEEPEDELQLISYRESRETIILDGSLPPVSLFRRGKLLEDDHFEA
jgi:hypothetical protein